MGFDVLTTNTSPLDPVTDIEYNLCNVEIGATLW